MSLLRRALARVTLPPDTWERHVLVAHLLGSPRTVLDVGGVAGQLRLFLPGTDTLTANVEEPADVVFEGERLPFEDASFDAATSLDVLEHIEPARRPAHLAELARVARSRVVLCCPLGSPGHVAAEEELGDWYEARTGGRHRFLDEHLRIGLPTVPELEDAAAAVPGFAFTLRFHGDYRTANEIFRRSVVARTGRRPGDLLAYARSRLLTRPDYALADEAGPYTNRVYAVGTRTG